MKTEEEIKKYIKKIKLSEKSTPWATEKSRLLSMVDALKWVLEEE